MKKKILKILFMTVFMICLFAAFSICSNAATYEPDGTTSTQYEFDAGECNRTIVVTCQDESGRLLKRVNVMTKRGEETFFMISMGNSDVVRFIMMEQTIFIIASSRKPLHTMIGMSCLESYIKERLHSRTLTV